MMHRVKVERAVRPRVCWYAMDSGTTLMKNSFAHTYHQIEIVANNTHSLSDKQVNFCWKSSSYTPFLQTFQNNFNHVIVEMIERPKIEGSQSQGILGQALSPLLAVTKEDSNPSLLLKQEGWLGPVYTVCSKTDCPLFLALLTF